MKKETITLLVAFAAGAVIAGLILNSNKSNFEKPDALSNKDIWRQTDMLMKMRQPDSFLPEYYKKESRKNLLNQLHTALDAMASSKGIKHERD